MRAVGADHEISCDARPVAQRDDCPIGAVGDVRDGLAESDICDVLRRAIQCAFEITAEDRDSPVARQRTLRSL
ncbi:hypothetical protein ACZ91_53600 [Streptomyces regensis]|nr:hypothetical protein ACZ91_53600 [Streptomyces regensis]